MPRRKVHGRTSHTPPERGLLSPIQGGSLNLVPLSFVSPPPAAVLRHPPPTLGLGRLRVDRGDLRGLLGSRHLHWPFVPWDAPTAGSGFRIARDFAAWGRLLQGCPCTQDLLTCPGPFVRAPGHRHIVAKRARTLLRGRRCLSPRGEFSRPPELGMLAMRRKAPRGRNLETETPAPKYICCLHIFSTC